MTTVYRKTVLMFFSFVLLFASLPIVPNTIKGEENVSSEETVENVDDSELENETQDSDPSFDGEIICIEENERVYPDSYIDPEIDPDDFVIKGGISFYSLEDELPDNYASDVTSIKDQGAYGACWSFATIASAESTYLIDNEEALDLSELQLAYFLYHSKDIADPLNLITEDYTSIGGSIFNEGGNMILSTYALASGIGLLDESDLSYENVSDVANGNMLPADSLCYSMDDYYLDEARWLSMSDMNSIKKAIYEDGAIAASYYDSLTYRSAQYNSYYCPETKGRNHAITIVGWDDNFDSSNFSYAPPSNGAWLVKNSWGTESSYLSEGYMWISYSDVNLSTSSAVQFFIRPVKQNEKIYQYDGSTGSQSVTVSGYMDTGNVYFAQNNERIREIGFFTSEAGTYFKISVYSDLTDDSKPSSGRMLYSEEGYAKYAGYHTLDIEEEILIEKDHSFSIVVSYFSDSSIKVPISKTSSSSSSSLYYNESIQTGESFYRLSENSVWKDLAVSNQACARIKAYTTNWYLIDYQLNGGINSSNNPEVYDDDSFIMLNDPERKGYIFDGWYLDPEFTCKVDSIPSDLSGNITLYAKWQRNNETDDIVFVDGVVSFETLQLVLSDSIDMHIGTLIDFMSIDRNDVLKLYYRIDQEDDNCLIVTEEMTDKNGYFDFVIELDARHVNSNVDIWTAVNEEVSEVKTVSIDTYASMIDKTDLKLVQLCDALKDYGTYANYYFNETEGIDPLQEVSLSELESYQYRILKPGSKDKLLLKSASLILDSTITLRIYYEKNPSSDISQYKCTVNGMAESERLTMTESYLEIKGIKPFEFSDMMDIVIGDETNKAVISLSYSPLSYAYSALKSPSASMNIKNLVQKMAVYGWSARSVKNG